MSARKFEVSCLLLWAWPRSAPKATCRGQRDEKREPREGGGARLSSQLPPPFLVSVFLSPDDSWGSLCPYNKRTPIYTAFYVLPV